MDNDDRPFIIESPTKIRLKPLAREMAKMHGMTETELARFLLAKHQAGDVPLPDDEDMS